MNIMKNFKSLKNIKKVITGLFVTMLFGAIATNAMAATPQFNFLHSDYQLFGGQNVTKNQTGINDPVSADPGDTVRGIIYLHNGQDNTTANNVRVAVTAPATDPATSLRFDAKVTADNAASITDTIVDGQLVGPSGFTVNLSQASSYNIVDGSVKVFRDGSTTPTPLTNGQTGAELFTPSGLLLGDAPACWAHVVFVTFDFKIKAPVATSPVIVKSKSAFNDTQHVDATTVVAHAGDQITYTLTTKNTGTGDQANFVIEDGVRDILDYADITAISDGGQSIDQPQAANRDDQTLVRYPAVTIKAGESVVRTFVVKVKNPIPTTPQNGNAFDHVMFNVYGTRVVIVIEQPSSPVITISKNVRNVSKNETTFVNANTASPGDTLEYNIEVKNINANSNANVLKDVLPNGVTFVSGSIVERLNNGVITPVGDLFGNGMNLPDLKANDDITVIFRVQTSDKLADSTNLVNVATVSGKQAQASTVILAPVKTVPTTPSPTIATTLPKTGANPFAIMTLITGLAYAFIKFGKTGKAKRLFRF